MLSNQMTDLEKDFASENGESVMRCARCSQWARRHPSGRCHDCRQKATSVRIRRRLSRMSARDRGLEAVARNVYDTDRDDNRDISDE